MNNEAVIKKFLEGKQAKTPLRNIGIYYIQYKGRTLYTRDNVLVNYGMDMARIENNNLFVNVENYSRTTSKIQTLIIKLGLDMGYNIKLKGEPDRVKKYQYLLEN